MKEMSLIEHLEELRKSAISVLIIIIVAFFVTYGFSDQLAEIVLSPLRLALKNTLASGGGEIIYLGLLDKILAQLQLSLWCAAILSAPAWFYQIWRFVRPGLHEHEARAVRPFLMFGLVLFWAGACFTYFVVFPFGFKLLLEYGVTDVVATISMREYLTLAMKLMISFGVLFQVPNFMLILGFMGVINSEKIHAYRRYIYVILAVLAAVFSPPDIFSMMIVWVPMVVLFEIGGLGLTLIVRPYLAKKAKT
ncbi:MAG: twin arginine-targeting protein translocase TatC [Bdellovibrionales bacterium GWA2_49_15]|nr:MAG: twin arginine-targeting protein translocase TatC [Bdellovibrionales bacterium GWA2_49_15]HAZ14214.1 twin-arginine translocase subunit TatC [Bdellovibrionales bacterium]